MKTLTWKGNWKSVAWSTCSIERHLDLCRKHAAVLQLLRELFAQKYKLQSVAMYSFIQLSKLEQCRVNELIKYSPQVRNIRTRVLLADIAKLCQLRHRAATRYRPFTRFVVSVVWSFVVSAVWSFVVSAVWTFVVSADHSLSFYVLKRCVCVYTCNGSEVHTIIAW